MAWHPPRPSITMTTDASLEAWGAHLTNLKVQGPWTLHQKAIHLNVLQDVGIVQKGLKAFLFKLKTSLCYFRGITRQS